MVCCESGSHDEHTPSVRATHTTVLKTPAPVPGTRRHNDSDSRGNMLMPGAGADARLLQVAFEPIVVSRVTSAPCAEPERRALLCLMSMGETKAADRGQQRTEKHRLK